MLATGLIVRRLIPTNDRHECRSAQSEHSTEIRGKCPQLARRAPIGIHQRKQKSEEKNAKAEKEERNKIKVTFAFDTFFHG
jgi:hypothetical protein